LASGLVGDGRLAEPEQIVEHINQYFATNSSALVVNNAPPLPPQTLLGKTVLITAGPTYEPIDPVRFVGNRSTGKMGIAIAEAAAQMGAKVYLVLGETNLLPQNKDIQVISAHTAQAMYEATTALFPEANIAILSAAVADYTPVDPQKSKIKKTGNVLTINLQKTLDILASLGKNKKDAQLLVGFALETDNEEENARKKLQNKNLDLIVLNSLRDEGAGFRHDTNKICIIDKENNKYDYPLKTKDEVALDIMNLIVKKIPTSG
jgi:phosphopantothenoylcysteine decarboxylase/phosphopantothenate--cysteine ligase